MTRALACLALLPLLTACGQTGPLYLPDQTPPASQQPPRALLRSRVSQPAAASSAPAATNAPAAPASNAAAVREP